MNKYLIYLIIILIALLGICNYGWEKDRKEKKRLSSNQEALLSDIDYYKTESGKNAASVRALDMKRRELEKHRSDLSAMVEDLNIKLKRVESTSTTAIESNYEIKTIIKDSIIYRDRVIPIVKCVEYRDRYITISGRIDTTGLFSGSIHTVDTLDQVVHRVPKRFLFIKYGTKAIRQEIVSRNPNSRIVYTEYVEIKR